ncbi:MAG: SBBP repeat-containing protein [Candidatus Odinarchaeota archaeon]
MTRQMVVLRKLILFITCISLLVIFTSVPVVNAASTMNEVTDNEDLVVFSTYLGGNGDDRGTVIISDSSGNIYITGTTRSTDFPTTAGAYNRTHSGYEDLFVIKLSANGSTIIFSTLIGRVGGLFTGRMVLDSSNNIIVAAPTDQSTFPTTDGVYDDSHNGDLDVIVAKLSANGSTLLFSTFIGGSDEDDVASLAVDSSDNIYIAGTTESNDFPTTPGAYEQDYNDGLDCYAAKLSADGTTLSFSTYIGGNGNEWYPKMALDSQDNIIIAGGTASDDYPTTPAALHSSPIGGTGLTWNPYGIICKDLFVSKLSADGSSLLYSTYFGGNHNEYVNAIVLDSTDNIIISGATGSTDFPTSNGAYDASYNGKDTSWISDIFLTKIAADGSTVLSSTYLGGIGNTEYGRALAIDGSDNIYLAGITGSGNFPVTENALDTTNNGNDIFFCKFPANCTDLLYSSFYGGSNTEDGFSIQIDAESNIILTGSTLSTDNMVKNAINATNNGQQDILVLKMKNPTITTTTTDTSTDTTNGEPTPAFTLTVIVLVLFTVFSLRKRLKKG